MTQRRLIEETFPLKKVSEDSKHEKNVRHGHISTLHIWPARRPLAACRAAIIAALMPDPGTEQERHELNKRIEKITRWGSENGPELDNFRQEIRRAFGERAPRVLDMFAGGGAIPLEAMRLGCDVTAIDYNPVAWFLLKCTLEFPQRLAGKTWPLPKRGGEEAKERRGEENQGSQSSISNLQSPHQLEMWSDEERPGSLADHVRYWGEWVLEKARAELAPYYPTINNQPTVAYLWARTVPCPDPACGAEVPLLKTLWLCNKENKRRALRLVPDPANKRVNFEIWTPGPDDAVPEGTMSGAKSRCSVCGINVTPDYIKACGLSGKLGVRMTTVVVETSQGKEYRLPTAEDEFASSRTSEVLPKAAAQIPHGIPNEPQDKNPRTFIVQLYGLDTWGDIFTPRQMLTLLTFSKMTRLASDEMIKLGYPKDWMEVIKGYLAVTFSKLADYCSTICVWELQGEEVKHTFQRFALPMAWDFAECNPIAPVDRYYVGGLRSVIGVLTRIDEDKNWANIPSPTIFFQSAKDVIQSKVDLIVTDPPYYDAIPYADISDFFYVWLRRNVGDQYPTIFGSSNTHKADELALRLPHIDIPDEHTPEWYEQGMATAFRRAWEALVPEGHLVIVFAHKNPDAWETLVGALINAGFTVTSSWPIDTEMRGGVRNLNRASLASSIWLVCRKRTEDAGVGRYSAVRRAMQERVTERLRYFWDLGVSGPDFVWAAVGPALESYSSYQSVRRLDGSEFTVGEFLKEVRRLVADFALGQILKGHSTEGLDEWTRYYLIHRSNFGLEGAPVGECILLSQGYGLDLNELRGPRGYIVKGAGSDIRLAKWDERRRDDLGQAHPSGGLPQIDMLHRLMHLWAAGNLDGVNAYADQNGLRQNELFWAVAQAILEMADAKSRERTLLEAIVAWGRGKVGESQVESPRLPTLD